MKECYYSDVLNKYFDTKKACEEAEKAEEERKAAEEKKASERKDRWQEILDEKEKFQKIKERCYAEIKEQREKINGLIDKFNKDYGGIRVQYTSNNMPKSIIDELIDTVRIGFDNFPWIK